VEGDASSASYFLAGAAITGGTVTVEGCGTSSLQVKPYAWQQCLWNFQQFEGDSIVSGMSSKSFMKKTTNTCKWLCEL
jgi:5-enolpyruvylshikimate-3-phosphate synthase